MPPAPIPPQQPSVPPRVATVVETDEDIRKALRTASPGQPAALGAAAPAPQPRPSLPPAARPYHPTLRPPIAILTVLDDHKNDGEVVRIRADRFVIGRSEGDFLIPHDPLISGRHVEITRQQVGGPWRWVITDLQTRNGLFVRISRTPLVDKAEFLVGKGRYRFQDPGRAPAPTVDDLPPDAPPGSTRPWGVDAAPLLQPILEELLGGGTGARIPLTQPEYWIGSDPACAICRAEDPFVEPRHVRLYRDARGGWHARNNKSLNGLWLRMPQITVEDGCLFQIGEQRLRLRVGR